MVFSWQSDASASSACVSFFSIIAVLIWATADSRADLDTVAFMDGVCLGVDVIANAICRNLPAILLSGQTELRVSDVSWSWGLGVVSFQHDAGTVEVEFAPGAAWPHQRDQELLP